MKAADDPAASVIETTGRLAWATAAFAFSVGGMRFVSPEGEALDAVLGLVVGGGAAYLAIALNSLPEAIAGASRIAWIAGFANGLMLPLTIIACVGGTRLTNLVGVGATEDGRVIAATIGVSVALIAAAAPWLLYWSLKSRHTRKWFAGAALSQHVPGGIWLRDD